jgi:hypothetical protein
MHSGTRSALNRPELSRAADCLRGQMQVVQEPECKTRKPVQDLEREHDKQQNLAMLHNTYAVLVSTSFHIAAYPTTREECHRAS